MLSLHSAGWVSLTPCYSVFFEDVNVRNLQLKIQNTKQFPLVTVTSLLPAERGSINDVVTFFFLIRKIPRLHSYTNFLHDWFLVGGPYPYFLSPHCKVVCFFSANSACCLFSSHTLTCILKPIPASFIMKVRAGMATEWTPPIFSPSSYRNFKCWVNNQESKLQQQHFRNLDLIKNPNIIIIANNISKYLLDQGIFKKKQTMLVPLWRNPFTSRPPPPNPQSPTIKSFIT